MATSSLDTLWVVTSHSLVRASAALLAWALSMGEAAATPLPVDLEATPLGSRGGYSVDLLWTVVAAILVFWMQAGFALLEAGFSRAKNVVNIMMKNLADLSLGSIAFWCVGFGIMFGTSAGWFGQDGFFLRGYEGRSDSYSFLLFQTVFCATAATIVSGAMAERTRFVAYLLFSLAITAFIYPVFGSWAWGSAFAGGGWLEATDGSPLSRWGLPPFIDFAGSTVVHSVGGWAALAGALALGPRWGKYSQTNEPQPLLGHSMVLATLGCFILWMGWFGFNAGSTLGVSGAGNEPFAASGKSFTLIALNTHLAACSGCAGSMFTSWKLLGKPDIGVTLNGALGGLVAITAGCAFVRPGAAMVIGAAAGAAVVASVLFFERRGVDDPVGAVSVHGVCGAWGTLAVALFHHQGFSGAQLASQTIGVASCLAWTFGTSWLVLRLLRAWIGVRVPVESEIEGLDLSEHAVEAYPSDMASEPLEPTGAWAGGR